LRMELTAGLNKPPLMRKKTQTLTASEKPKAREMYKREAMLGPVIVTGFVLAT